MWVFVHPFICMQIYACVHFLRNQKIGEYAPTIIYIPFHAYACSGVLCEFTYQKFERLECTQRRTDLSAWVCPLNTWVRVSMQSVTETWQKLWPWVWKYCIYTLPHYPNYLSLDVYLLVCLCMFFMFAKFLSKSLNKTSQQLRVYVGDKTCGGKKVIKFETVSFESDKTKNEVSRNCQEESERLQTGSESLMHF